jgi:hypothetical protein
MALRSPPNLAIQSPQAEKTLSARAPKFFVICDFLCDLPQGCSQPKFYRALHEHRCHDPASYARRLNELPGDWPPPEPAP